MMWKLWNRLRRRNTPAAQTARTDAAPHDLRAVNKPVRQGGISAQPLQSDRARLVRHIADHPDQALAHLAHHDGYVREAALRHVRVADASPTVALLVLERCNDWVPQVRRLAMARLRDVVAVLPDADLFPLVGAILGRAINWQRWGNDMGGLANLFDKPAMRNAVNAYLITASHGPVVRQARWAMRLGIVDTALADLAVCARSSALRAVATECLLDGKVYWTDGLEKVWIDKPMGLYRTQPRWRARELGPASCDRVALLRAGAGDKNPAVRRVVAEYLCKTGPAPALVAVIASLSEDKNPKVAHRMHYFRQKWLMNTA